MCIGSSFAQLTQKPFYRVEAVRRVIGVIIHPISSAINKQVHNKLANISPRKQMLPRPSFIIPWLQPQNTRIEDTNENHY